MTIERRSRLELKKPGNKGLAQIISGAHKIFKERHPKLKNIPLSPTTPEVTSSQPIQAETIKVYPEISLEEEWQRQAQRFVELGFHTELDLTEEQYIASLPKFEPQPNQFKGRFDIPVIVETRVPLKRMLKLAGIVNYFHGFVYEFVVAAIVFDSIVLDSIKDWKKGKFKTPDAPYTAWVNNGYSNLSRSVNAVRKSLKTDERGANIYDGTLFT